MKKITYFLASSAAALLLVASPMLVSANNDSSDKRLTRAEARERIVWNLKHNTRAVGAGTVTSINGSTFTIKPFGTKATTTVSTASTTVYRVNGEATTSAALQVGSNIVLAGNTNSDTSIAASIVGIFTRGFGFFKHVLFH